MKRLNNHLKRCAFFGKFFLTCFFISLISLKAFSNEIPVSDLINKNGYLNLDKGIVGTLNIKGWQVRLDDCLGPQFSPSTTGWSALDRGLGSSVNAIAINGTDVYVGGNFSNVGSGGTLITGLSCIAKWNGSAWSALDRGLGGAVNAIAISGSDVYVGGIFSNVGSGGTLVTGLSCIAKWNGSAWSALDRGLGSAVNAIAVSGADVYVGGIFSNVGSGGTLVTGLSCIAKWNGSTWSALDRGLGAAVNAIAISGPDIYVGGNFSNVGAGGTLVTGLSCIAKWNGSSWSALDRGLGSAVNAIAISGTDVYVGGNFLNVGSGGTLVTGLSCIAKWNGSSWSALDRGLGSTVNAIAASGIDAYVGGNFLNVGSGGTLITGLSCIAKWTGASVLPITLIDFNIKGNSTGNLISWLTTNEQSIKEYQVEYSLNSLEWKKLYASPAHNNGTLINHYFYSHVSIYPLIFYRLKIIDENNEFLYSNIIRINNKKQIIFYPVPASDKLFIQLPSNNEAVIEIIDYLGHVIKKMKRTTSSLEISLMNLNSGSYIIKVIQGNETYSDKFIKK